MALDLPFRRDCIDLVPSYGTVANRQVGVLGTYRTSSSVPIPNPRTDSLELVY